MGVATTRVPHSREGIVPAVSLPEPERRQGPARILFISICPEVSGQVRRLAGELGVALEVFEGGMTKGGLQYARENQERFDVILSHGGTAAHIEAAITAIPVITIKLSITDFLEGFERAIQPGRPLALFCAESEALSEMEKIAVFSGRATYRGLSYASKEDFERKYRLAGTLEGHTLIGISCYCLADMQVQLRGRDIAFSLIRPSERNIRKALLSARSIVENKAREELKAKRMKSIVDYSAQGIISCDAQGVVTSFNPAAEHILGLEAPAVLARALAGSEMPAAVRTLFGTGGFEINRILKVAGADMLVNRIPLTARDQPGETIVSFQLVTDLQRLEVKARMQLQAKGLVARHRFEDIVGESVAIRAAIETARRFSETTASVLVEGETGTGKELFAQSIHSASSRRDGPFVAINCAALPETLLESELFGYAEGAFTGAKRGGKAGLFELAHNGTIFLDEIGEIAPAIQSRLLRVLQEREILRVGGDRVMKVNVRVVAATNKNLYRMVREGTFREDLFFRLNVLNFRLPPLRQRPDDIGLLADRFVLRKNAKYGRGVSPLTSVCKRLLEHHGWPGNVRELEYFIEKFVILADPAVSAEEFVARLLREHVHDLDGGEPGRAHRPGGEDEAGRMTLEIAPLKEMQRQIVEEMLRRLDGNRGEVARRLGISRGTVWNRMREAEGPRALQ